MRTFQKGDRVRLTAAARRRQPASYAGPGEVIDDHDLCADGSLPADSPTRWPIEGPITIGVRFYKSGKVGSFPQGDLMRVR